MFSADKAFITQATFRAWLRLFIAASKCSIDAPVLLIVDNHSSRFDAVMRQEAQDAGVIMLALPANSTHKLQPLDDSLFGQYKSGAHNAVDNALLRGEIITSANRIALISPAWRDAMTPEHIKAAFQHTGVWPPRDFPGHTEPLPQPLPQAQHSQSSSQAALQLEKPEDVYTEAGMLRIRNLLDIPDGYERVWVFPQHPETKQSRKGSDKGFARILAVPALKSLIEDKGARKEERETVKADVQAALEGKETEKRVREPDAEPASAPPPSKHAKPAARAEATEPSEPRSKRARTEKQPAEVKGDADAARLQQLHEGAPYDAA